MKKKKEYELEMWYDGACEPKNPGGYASYGVIIKKIDGTVLFEESKMVGHGDRMSNNVAEYSGAISGLKWLIVKGYQKSRILVRGDNKMSVMQMGGFWKVRTWDGLYVPYWREAKTLLEHFKHIDFKWIPREENGEADEISKRILVEEGIKFEIQPEDKLTKEYQKVLK